MYAYERICIIVLHAHAYLQTCKHAWVSIPSSTSTTYSLSSYVRLVGLCICVYMHVHMYIRTCIHAYPPTHAYSHKVQTHITHIHACIHTTHAHMLLGYMLTFTSKDNLKIHTRTDEYIPTCIYIYTHYIHTCVHLSMHAWMHIWHARTKRTHYTHIHQAMSKCTCLHHPHLPTLRKFGLGAGGIAGSPRTERLDALI